MRQTVRVKNKTEFRPVSPVGGGIYQSAFSFPSDGPEHSFRKKGTLQRQQG